MRKFLLASVMIATPLVSQAANVHGFCVQGGGSTCNNNGSTNLVDSGTGLPDVGFDYTGNSAVTGLLTLELLVPTNLISVADAATAKFQVQVNSGVTPFTSGLFSTTPFGTSANQKLDSYLGINASGANPVGNYAGSKDVPDPTASEFYVYQFKLGSQTLSKNGANGPKQPTIQFLADLANDVLAPPEGSYLMAFFKHDDNISATANSESFLFDSTCTTQPDCVKRPPCTGPNCGDPPPNPVPEPETFALLGLGLLGLGFARRRSA